MVVIGLNGFGKFCCNENPSGTEDPAISGTEDVVVPPPSVVFKIAPSLPVTHPIFSSLKQTLETRTKKDPQWQVPIISTVATERTNIDKLHDKINEHIAMLSQNGRLEQKRQEQISKKIIGILKNRYEKEFLEKVIDEVDFDKIASDVFSGETNPYQVAGELFDKFKK